MSRTTDLAKTTTTERAELLGDPAAPGRRRRSNRRGGRVATVAVLIASFCGTWLLQDAAYSYRSAAISRGRPKTGGLQSRTANLDSFSLGLLLGGLRGPLVMYLWTSSETQKSERDLESFDTQLELIRLLQPEFAQVHLFQMWNLAYNVSVQMASLSNKYSCILAAIEYGRQTDRQDLPNNINIISQIGTLYGDKLGGSQEKTYYIPRVRTETLPVYRVTMPTAEVERFRKAAAGAGLDAARIRVTEAPRGTSTALVEKLAGDKVKAALAGAAGVTFDPVPRQSLRRGTRSGRPSEMDTLVDENGRLLPENLVALTKVPAGEVGNDGAELQYLEPFQPFTYGVPPHALAYNYHKRAQVLATVARQRHIQTSEMVIDRQPALALKFWAEEEWQRARRLEAEGLLAPGALEAATKLQKDIAAPEDVKRAGAYGLVTAALRPDATPLDRDVIANALFSYDRTAQTATAALAEYERHLLKFTSNLQVFAPHVEHMRMVAAIAGADAKYLRAMAATPAERPALLAEAKGLYEQAERSAILLFLKWYVEDVDAQRIRYARETLDPKSTAELRDIYNRTQKRLDDTYKKSPLAPNLSDQEEYAASIDRARLRVKAIGG